MLISAYRIKDNLAVWNALLQHVKLIGEKNCKILVNRFFYDNHLTKKEKLEYQYHIIDNRANLIKFVKNNIDDVFTISIFDTLEIYYIKKLFFKKFSISYWVQGAVPEESFMRNFSKTRYNVLSYLEKKALKKADKHIFVSSAMQEHYIKKYNFDSSHCITVPCSSDLVYDGSKKIENSFCYIGGLSKWQRVDKALDLFSEIRKIKQNSVFHFITKDIEKANKLIQENFKDIQDNIKVYSLSDRKEIQTVLSKMQFGFLLRDDNIVNNVSSPIKLAEYLSCDVNVLISSSVSSYSGLVDKYDAGYIIGNESMYNKIKYNKNESLNLYNKYFSFDLLQEKYSTFFEV